uniref:Cyclic nucleotide-binding domain-containing protein n=1 Tax=Euplotes harpa TaxID=151035 RepID=A0A7S3N8U7_9SPIT|mmetsp:Transcript_34719/g.40171  ORF Transcript_34719/g.40171 Transcript_34719/m.40171 type:complete len:374 (+) Transcript_34719:378-1499(+)
MNDINQKAAKLQDKINSLTEFARKTKLPNPTVEKIKKFFENNQEADSDIIDPNLLADLPVAIKSQIMNFTHQEIIDKISFLKSVKKNLLWLILPLMKPMRFFEKDTIYRQQEQPDEVIFIYEGDVILSLDINDKINGKPILIPFNKYRPGSYFGDSDIFCKQLRDSNAFCTTDVNVLVLSQDDLISIVQKDEELAETMTMIAMERSSVHIQRMCTALVKHSKVTEFARKIYPDTGVKRNTAAEFARNLVRLYLEKKPKELSKEERMVLRALNEEKVLSSAVVPEMEVEPLSLEEKQKIEKAKIVREQAKYSEGLGRMRDNAKEIQKSTLRIKTNNRLINSRLNDINESARIISQKQSSMEELVYRILVRVSPE